MDSKGQAGTHLSRQTTVSNSSLSIAKHNQPPFHHRLRQLLCNPSTLRTWPTNFWIGRNHWLFAVQRSGTSERFLDQLVSQPTRKEPSRQNPDQSHPFGAFLLSNHIYFGSKRSLVRVSSWMNSLIQHLITGYLNRSSSNIRMGLRLDQLRMSWVAWKPRSPEGSFARWRTSPSEWKCKPFAMNVSYHYQLCKLRCQSLVYYCLKTFIWSTPSAPKSFLLITAQTHHFAFIIVVEIIRPLNPLIIWIS